MQVWNVCTQLAGNAGPKKLPKIFHLGTIAQLCWAISLQLRHASTIGKKLVKHRCIPHMSSQYGELRPTSGWDPLASLGHPSKFQRVSRLGSITAWYSSSGHERRWTEGATCIRQGGHHVRHWPTFLVSYCKMQQSQLHDWTTSCHTGHHCTIEHKEPVATKHNID